MLDQPLTLNLILEAKKSFVKTPIASKASLSTSNHKQRKTHKTNMQKKRAGDRK
jgi:hypothetical protein